MLGCIPVTMTDYVYQPFEPEIDWNEFSVPIQEKEIPKMAEILEGLSDKHVTSLQEPSAALLCHLYGQVPTLVGMIVAMPLQEPPDLCSYADIKSSHFPCKECAKLQRSHLLMPGGAICCSASNIAKCPRLWE
eukprot:gene2433-8756_t